MGAFWRRKVEDPDATPLGFRTLFPQASLAALWENGWPICVGSRCLLAAGATSVWKPKLLPVNQSKRGFGVRVEHVGARDWLVFPDCSNAFNTVERAEVLKELAMCAPGLAPFVAICYHRTPADVFYYMESDERQTILSETGVYQRDALGQSLLCMPLGTRLATTRQRFDLLDVKASAYMGAVCLAFLYRNVAAVEAMPFLRHSS